MIKIIDFNNYARRMMYAGQTIKQFMYEAYNDEFPHIWVCDGFNCNARRREIYPEYKAGRHHEKGDTIFEALDFIKNNLKHTNAIQIEVPLYEADDVIATLVKSLKGEEIYIESNDLDLAALTVQEGVTINRKFDIDPKLIPIYKTLVGDPSDNIKGLTGLGPKTFLKQDWSLLIGSLESDAGFPDVNGLPEKTAESIWKEWVEIKKWWKIINFIDVPMNLIEQYTTYGNFNPKLIQYPGE